MDSLTRNCKNVPLKVRLTTEGTPPPHQAQTVCSGSAIGDVRVNQNPQLTVFQILQLREHNRLARELARLNPHWDDERLYQEARKINIAQHQGVTYNEWLPIILGKLIY